MTLPTSALSSSSWPNERSPRQLLQQQLGPRGFLEWLNSLNAEQLEQDYYTWRGWRARPKQLKPLDANDPTWLTLAILAGRGFGKSRGGAEIIREWWEEGVRVMAIVARTPDDFRKSLLPYFTGERQASPFLPSSVFPPHERPAFHASSPIRLEWANGATAFVYSGAEPDKLRGPTHERAWADELAAWEYPEQTWEQLQFTMRGAERPQVVVSTTPRPILLLRKILKRESTRKVSGTSYENLEHLSPAYREILEQYEGTRLGRQEIHAALLEEQEGAHWTHQLIEDTRVQEKDFPREVAVPAGIYSRRLTMAKVLKRVVIAVDPAVGSEEHNNETGICAMGIDGRKPRDHGYLLADKSGRYSPEGWAKVVSDLYRELGADCIVGEVNNGGDLVERNIKALAPNLKVKKVHATRGKYKRAEPVANLMEQGRIHHVGMFSELEDQLCSILPEPDPKQPSDRHDAYVWGFTELLVGDAVTIGGFTANL